MIRVEFCDNCNPLHSHSLAHHSYKKQLIQIWRTNEDKSRFYTRIYDPWTGALFITLNFERNSSRFSFIMSVVSARWMQEHKLLGNAPWNPRVALANANKSIANWITKHIAWETLFTGLPQFSNGATRKVRTGKPARPGLLFALVEVTARLSWASHTGNKIFRI